MLNLEGIRQLKFDMRANAERYDQGDFGRLSSCGTIQCMAGFCYLREMGEEKFISSLNTYGIAFDSVVAGIKQLGLNVSVSVNGQPYIAKNPDIFCSLGLWPVDLALDYRRAKTAHERVEVACRALDRLKEDGSIMSLEEYAEFTKDKAEAFEVVNS